MEPHLRVGIDVGYRSHRVAIATPDGEIVEEFDISHSTAGFEHFFHRVERHRKRTGVSVAVAMEGYNGYAQPLDRLIREKRHWGQVLQSNIRFYWSVLLSPSVNAN